VYNSCNLFLDLQKLALQKQENLATLALQCQSLQEMDLTDCESLTNSICDVFSDGGGCPKLKSLVLDNCEVCELWSFCPFCLCICEICHALACAWRGNVVF
jgi:hypothetical protein